MENKTSAATVKLGLLVLERNPKLLTALKEYFDSVKEIDSPDNQYHLYEVTGKGAKGEVTPVFELKKGEYVITKLK